MRFTPPISGTLARFWRHAARDNRQRLLRPIKVTTPDLWTPEKPSPCARMPGADDKQTGEPRDRATEPPGEPLAKKRWRRRGLALPRGARRYLGIHAAEQHRRNVGRHRRRRPVDDIAVRHLPRAICQGRAAEENRPAAEDAATRYIMACDEDWYRVLSHSSPVGSAKLKAFQGEPTALWPIVRGMAAGS